MFIIIISVHENIEEERTYARKVSESVTYCEHI